MPETAFVLANNRSAEFQRGKCALMKIQRKKKSFANFALAQTFFLPLGVHLPNEDGGDDGDLTLVKRWSINSSHSWSLPKGIEFLVLGRVTRPRCWVTLSVPLSRRNYIDGLRSFRDLKAWNGKVSRRRRRRLWKNGKSERARQGQNWGIRAERDDWEIGLLRPTPIFYSLSPLSRSFTLQCFLAIQWYNLFLRCPTFAGNFFSFSKTVVFIFATFHPNASPSSGAREK